MRQLRCSIFTESEVLVDCFLEKRKNRFTDLNIGYEIDENDQRTDEKVLRDMEKAGTKVIRLSEKPPKSF